MHEPTQLLSDLDREGFSRQPSRLSRDECEEIRAYWEEPSLFRKEIEMERHGYGVGTYRYFAAPLPNSVNELRRQAYPRLAEVANIWQERLGQPDRFPTRLEALLSLCAEHGQTEPTPLLLSYERDGYNRLHQDRYGEVAFPLQMVTLLSASGTGAEFDFSGGEFLLTEGRTRMQSKGTSITLQQGESVVFPNQVMPVRSKKGYSRASVRHGVSTVRSGIRFALGVIFHDAK